MGLTLEEEVLVNFELSQCSPVFRSIAGTNNGIGSMGIVIDGTEEQKRKYLPRLASGELIGSFALTEPGSGSDAGALATSARREGDHYLLNGTKRFITNAPEAGIFTVMARTDPNTKDASGVSGSSSKPNARLVARTDRQEDGPAWRAHLRCRFRGCEGSCSQYHRRQGRHGIQDRNEGPGQGPTQYRCGVRGCGGTHAAGRASLCHGAAPVRSPGRGVPARAGDARRLPHRDIRRALDGAGIRAQTRRR